MLHKINNLEYTRLFEASLMDVLVKRLVEHNIASRDIISQSDLFNIFNMNIKIKVDTANRLKTGNIIIAALRKAGFKGRIEITVA